MNWHNPSIVNNGIKGTHTISARGMEFPHRNILLLPNSNSMHDLNKFKPSIILFWRDCSPEGELQMRTIPGFSDS
jgi:hypothetical protein